MSAGEGGEAEVLEVAYTRHAPPQGGRPAALASLVRWGGLRALGARRGWKAKVVPVTLVLIAMGPALVVLGVRALFGGLIDRTPIDIDQVLPYADYQSLIGVVILIFAVVLAPDLLCPDRRDGVLSLYFSTAVDRRDYVLGRALGAIIPLLMVTLAPMLLLFGGIAFFDDSPLGYLTDQWVQLVRIVASGVLLAVYFGLVALAVASLTARKAYAVGGYVLLLIASTSVAVLAQEALGSARYLELAELSSLPVQFARLLFPGTSGEVATPLWAYSAAYTAVVVCAGALLWRRYARERV